MSVVELGLIRAEEFRKNAIKFGWQLWDDNGASKKLDFK